MAAQNRVQTSAQGATRSAGERVQENRSGAREKFPEPRGWALKWDGFALSMVRERRNGRTPTPAA
jgi:hypothetical protein